MAPSVLLVDDDPHICELALAVLRANECDVAVATSVRQAREQAAKRDFELIVTDLIMPDEDGMQFITELKKSGSKARIIAISGGGRLDSGLYLEIAQRLRVDGVLAKPFGAAELLEVVGLALKIEGRSAHPSASGDGREK